jgi:hypothetical protein
LTPTIDFARVPVLRNDAIAHGSAGVVVAKFVGVKHDAAVEKRRLTKRAIRKLGKVVYPLVA